MPSPSTASPTARSQAAPDRRRILRGIEARIYEDPLTPEAALREIERLQSRLECIADSLSPGDAYAVALSLMPWEVADRRSIHPLARRVLFARASHTDSRDA
ncbi:MAG: hypothetical protein AAF791_09985 [Bacteroidota bacterium]